MEPIIKKLDHEFAANAKLSLDEIVEASEEIKGLKPLPAEIKYNAIKLALTEIKKTIDCEISISEGEFISSAVINFNKFRKEKEIKINDEEGLDKLTDIIIIELLRLTQNNIRSILTEKDENFKDYYRSDAFFESSRNSESITINWSRARNVNK